MARRKKNRKRVDGFVFPTPIAGLIILLAITGISYLWLCSCAEKLGSQIKVLEVENSKLADQLQNEQYRWTRLKAPRNIEHALAKYGITMVWPRPEQVIQLADVSVTDAGMTAMSTTVDVAANRVARISPRHQHE